MRNALFILLALYAFAASAQSNEGDLSMKKSKIYLDNKLLKPKEILKIMEANPEAYAAYKKAKANYDAGQVIGFVGGFMIGFPLGTALGGGDPQWGLAAGGVGLLLLNLPLVSGYKKHASRAIELYNGESRPTARNYFVEFAPTPTGAKLMLRF